VQYLFGQSGDFLIWSSSRLATASNSPALPYIVVELKLLTLNQSGAFFFRLIVKLNPELCSCARPIAHYALPSPPLPTIVLLLQLQALYECPLLNLYYYLLDPTGRKTSNFEPYLRPFY
jgi:hypothetical protein